MIGVLFTIYLIAGVIVSGFTIVGILLDNTFSKKQYFLCAFFFPHTIIVVLICWVSYAYVHHRNMMRRIKEREGN